MDRYMINVVKKRSPSKAYVYCVYVGTKLVLQTRSVVAIGPWLKLQRAA